MKHVSSLVTHKEEEFTLQDRMSLAQWQREDDRLHAEREAHSKTMQSQLELDALQSLEQEIESRMHKLQLEREEVCLVVVLCVYVRL
jgi:hypothetical protein